MSMIKKITSLLLPAALGGGTALMVVTLAEPDGGAQESAPEVAKKPTKGASSRQSARVYGDRAPIVRRRSRDLEEPSDEPALKEAAQTAAPPLPEEALLDPEQARQQVLSMWEQRLDDHAAANVDRDWAAEVQPQFEADLRELGEGLFEVSNVDCRSDTCVARVGFDSYADATGALNKLVHHHFEAQCGTTVVMPEPEEPDAQYTTDVYFDCAEARS